MRIYSKTAALFSLAIALSMAATTISSAQNNNSADAEAEYAAYGARFVGQSFVGKKMRGSRLFFVRCERCDFSGADMRAARVVASKFFDSDLRGADFTEAFFQKNLFVGADFRGAKLDKAFFAQNEFRACIADAKTQLPWARGSAEARGFVFRD